MLQYIIDAYKDKTGDDGFWDIKKKSEKTDKICLVLIIVGFCTAYISIFFKSVLFYILSVVFVGVVTLFYVCMIDNILEY
ncbi:MAG: hypothetical protein E7263_04170 [Lachnospiraceae bacterium]|nr:hypothetical protein [Lachnospiraceae bacterium]